MSLDRPRRCLALLAACIEPIACGASRGHAPSAVATPPPDSAAVDSAARVPGCEATDYSPADALRPPELLPGPRPEYPAAGNGRVGRVVFEFVLDTAGRPIPATIRVVEASDPIFVAPAQLALLFRHYRPALLQGHPVCVRIRQPVEMHPPK